MRQGVSSFILNVALVVGVTATAAIIAAAILPRHQTSTRFVAERDVPSPVTTLAASAPALDRLRSGTASEPFEPPAPPMEAAAPVASDATNEQVAALTPVEPAPPPAVSPLRTVELDSHEIHVVPGHDEAVRPITIVNLEDGAGKPARVVPRRATEAPLPRRAAAPAQETAAQEEAAPEAAEAGGVKLAGPAIVTSALELNVGGKPLRLFGVRPPASGDMCAPSANFAARSCPDVSRQALAARVGTGGEVSCRVLAAGGSTLPAVCADRTGTDLATYLVEQGFALADPNDMVDYSAAETQAKTAHSGLWSYR